MDKKEIKLPQNTEEKLIQDNFDALISEYLTSNHRKRVDRITRAFNFANQTHKGVKRASGEPYILHPIAVARIVCTEIGLGSTSICAALLHDVVEDTDYTIEDVENIFGEKIAQLVNGLTKISGGVFGDKASAQAENFKKLLLTMNDDIRVILIKMADRLHNMRTLGSLPPNKQYKIAGETLYIYAPLANRLGLNKIKSELEDLSFRYEHPEEYEEISEKLRAGASLRDESYEKFADPIRETLDKMGLQYDMKERVKSVYSIWNKMQTKHVSFDEIYDLLAARITFQPKCKEEEINTCFAIYSAISKIYKPHPSRLRDWVSHPKANGYQALHATFMSKEGQWIEVQIRSYRMHEIAEQGFAAHWKYKEGILVSEDEGELDKLLKSIKEVLDDPQPDAVDLLDTIKLNFFASEIFVFTPKGDIKTMPQNSTALDFAFSIHTYVGTHCIGAKVNHKLVPLSYKLQSGDQVEILTSKVQRVQPSWINLVTTARAKSKINAIVHKEMRIKEKRGKEMLEEFLKEENILVDTQIIDKLSFLHEVKRKEDLYIGIASGTIKLGEADRNLLREKTSKGWKKFIPLFNLTKNNKEKETETLPAPAKEIDKKKVLNLTDEVLKNEVKLADCCKPIPGDDVLGYIDDHGHIHIHKRQCTVAARLKSNYGNRIIAAKWDKHIESTFPVNLYMKGISEVSLLNQITQIISIKHRVDIRHINIETKDDIFEANLEIYAHDVNDIKQLIASLHQIKMLQEIYRVE